MKNNKPTLGFVKSFLNCYPELSLRQANPIKRSRASVSREDMTEFFNRFSKSVEGVAPENLFNLDESAIMTLGPAVLSARKARSTLRQSRIH